LTKSTAHRLAGVLERRGLLWRDPKSLAYSLGPAILALVKGMVDQRDLAAIGYPYMLDLRERTGETVGLHVRVGRERACIAQLECPHELRMRLDIGRPLPLYCGAASKVLLAHLPMEEIEHIIRETGLRAIGPGSITRSHNLRQELQRIREQGYATSRQERSVGGITVAAPVRDRSGAVIASLSVYGPILRIDDKCLQRWAPWVIRAADAISREMGVVPAHRQAGRTSGMARTGVKKPGRKGYEGARKAGAA
jgi:DNA-binding IclR family transcriptional regulator